MLVPSPAVAQPYEGGLVMQGYDDDPYHSGALLDVGPGRLMAPGQVTKMAVPVGALVLLPAGSGVPHAPLAPAAVMLL